MYSNRKRAQTKAVNQARKEQEAAAAAGQPHSEQPPAGDATTATAAAVPSASSLPLASARELPEGASLLRMDTDASQPAFGQLQAQQQYGGTLLPPAGTLAYQTQHQYSNDASAYLPMTSQATAAHVMQQPHGATFAMPTTQSAPYLMVPQSVAYGMVPVQNAAVSNSMLYAPVPHSTPSQMHTPQYAAAPLTQHQQQQQQQSQVLNLRPLPGQSMAEAAMAAIQAQQVFLPEPSLDPGDACMPRSQGNGWFLS